MLKIKAKRLFTLGNLGVFAIPFLHSCIAAYIIVQPQQLPHVSSNGATQSALDDRKTRPTMAYMNTAAGFGPMDRVANAFKAAKEMIRRRRVYTQTVAELRALSTRELNDLAISRSMITRIALEAAYGKTI